MEQNINHNMEIIAEEKAKKTVNFFKIYAGFMILLYVLVALLGFVFVIFNESMSDAENPPVLIIIYGVMFVLTGLIFAAFFSASFFLPKNKAGYIVNLVLIAFSLSSCCFWPFCIPLLIQWLKPEVKKYYQA